MKYKPYENGKRCEYSLHFIINYSFEKYDEDLSGEISAEDLSYLLEDMGGHYSESEVDLIITLIDPDQLDFIEFAEFVHWWTTDNPRA